MKQYVIDAFTDQVFSGNPAAICVMDAWLDDDLMMNITRENNLSETAFTVKEGDSYSLRWFTPGGEIDLCGHATLATAYVIHRFIEPGQQVITFDTKSGVLTVTEREGLFEMEFPAYELSEVEVSDRMIAALGATPRAAYKGRDLLCIMDDEDTVRSLTPDLTGIKELDGLLVHVSAEGRDFDCVSRSFALKMGIAEDPVCGSGHCHILPYWAEALDKTEFTAYQASSRGGIVHGRVTPNGVTLAGPAVLYAESEIHVG